MPSTGASLTLLFVVLVDLHFAYGAIISGRQVRGLFGGIFGQSSSTVLASLKEELGSLTAGLAYGMDATPADKQQIESIISHLSQRSPSKNPATVFPTKNTQGKISAEGVTPEGGRAGANARLVTGSVSDLLNGGWRLMYTDAPDVLNIGTLPGVSLEYVGQTVSFTVAAPAAGSSSSDSIFSGDNLITNFVLTEGALASTSQQIAVRASQLSPTRVGLQFVGIRIIFDKIFGQSEVFGRSVDSLIGPFEIKFKDTDFNNVTIRKSSSPYSATTKIAAATDEGGASSAGPSFEILYLDQDLRIQRTNEDFLFILSRAADVKTRVRDLAPADKLSRQLPAGRASRKGTKPPPTAAAPAAAATGREPLRRKRGAKVEIQVDRGRAGEGGDEGEGEDRERAIDTAERGLALGPWLKSTIGDSGMRALGLVSLIPYLLFFYRFLSGQ